MHRPEILDHGPVIRVARCRNADLHVLAVGAQRIDVVLGLHLGRQLLLEIPPEVIVRLQLDRLAVVVVLRGMRQPVLPMQVLERFADILVVPGEQRQRLTRLRLHGAAPARPPPISASSQSIPSSLGLQRFIERFRTLATLERRRDPLLSPSPRQRAP